MGRLQTSTDIRRHLNELHAAFELSYNKELLEETIEFWEGEFTVKLDKERRYRKQLRNN